MNYQKRLNGGNIMTAVFGCLTLISYFFGTFAENYFRSYSYKEFCDTSRDDAGTIWFVVSLVTVILAIIFSFAKLNALCIIVSTVMLGANELIFFAGMATEDTAQCVKGGAYFFAIMTFATFICSIVGACLNAGYKKQARMNEGVNTLAAARQPQQPMPMRQPQMGQPMQPVQPQFGQAPVQPQFAQPQQPQFAQPQQPQFGQAPVQPQFVQAPVQPQMGQPMQPVQSFAQPAQPAVAPDPVVEPSPVVEPMDDDEKTTLLQ